MFIHREDPPSNLHQYLALETPRVLPLGILEELQAGQEVMEQLEVQMEEQLEAQMEEQLEVQMEEQLEA
jgi:hypothetical protein